MKMMAKSVLRTVIFSFAAFAAITVSAQPAPTYGPPAVPWDGSWPVKNSKLSPGVDYHINHYAEWKADVLAAYAKATAEIEKQAAAVPTGTLWGVVMDIDDTILDHAVHNRRNEEAGETFKDDVWRGWVQAKGAMLVPGAKEFMEKVNQLGGRIVLISNIKDYEELPVRTRLAELGVHQGPHYAYVLARVLGSQSAKPERQGVVASLIRLTDKDATKDVPVMILGSVGDQNTDKMENAPFFPIPQGSAEWGMYGDPAVGKAPPAP